MLQEVDHINGRHQWRWRWARGGGWATGGGQGEEDARTLRRNFVRPGDPISVGCGRDTGGLKRGRRLELDRAPKGSTKGCLRRLGRLLARRVAAHEVAKAERCGVAVGIGYVQGGHL